MTLRRVRVGAEARCDKCWMPGLGLMIGLGYVASQPYQSFGIDVEHRDCRDNSSLLSTSIIEVSCLRTTSQFSVYSGFLVNPNQL